MCIQLCYSSEAAHLTMVFWLQHWWHSAWQLLHAAQALRLLHYVAEGQLWGRVATHQPSWSLILIMDGDEHGRDILYSNQDILMADLVEEACIPNKRTWKTKHEEHCLPRTCHHGEFWVIRTLVMYMHIWLHFIGFSYVSAYSKKKNAGMWNCIHVAQAEIYQQHYWGWQMQTVHMNVQSHTSRIYTVITMKFHFSFIKSTQ